MTTQTGDDRPQQNAGDGGAQGPAAHAKATRREWLGLAAIALPCLLYSMDLTVLNLALPTISAELKPSGPQLLWIVDIYGFMVAGFLITMGGLGDRIGRRRLLLAGAASFGAASILAAFAKSAESLIVMRAVLGVAGATLAPSTLSLIRNMFHDERERTTAIGIWIASYSAGGAIGPLVGGVLLEHFWWGSVFLIAVPVMALLLAFGPSLLPEFRDPDAGPLDLPSAALSLSATLSIVYGLKHGAEHGLSAAPALSLLAGLALAAVFVRRQTKLASPLIDLNLFRKPGFGATLAGYGLGGFVMLGVYIFIGQYLQLVVGLSPLKAGLATTPWALAFVAGSLLVPRLTRYVRAEDAIPWGMGVASCGFALITLVGGRFGLFALIVGTVLMALGMAPLFTLGNEMIVGKAPPERAGAASAISETSAELSGALGIAIFGSAGSVAYRYALAGNTPEGLSADQARAASATLGQAIVVAEGLPAAAREALLDASRAAFVESMRLAAGASAVVLACAALLVARMLRHPPAGVEGGGDEAEAVAAAPGGCG